MPDYDARPDTDEGVPGVDTPAWGSKEYSDRAAAADALGELAEELAKEAETGQETEACCIGQNVPPSAAALRAQAQQMLADAAHLDRQEARDRQLAREANRPRMPLINNPGDSAVVIFNRYQSGKDYQYAAIGWREGRAVRWAVTGQNTERYNWPGLLEWIGEANWSSVHVVTDVERIGPDPEAEAPLREVMGKFGRVERTEAVQPQGVDPFAAGGVVGHLIRGQFVPSPFYVQGGPVIGRDGYVNG